LALTHAVSAQSVVPSKGKEFWLGFMNNFSSAPGDDALSVYVVSDHFTSGTVSIPGQGWSQSFSVVPGTTTTVNIPNSIAEIQSNQLVESKGVFIATEDTVAVFAFNYQSSSMDGTLVLPVQSLGTDYSVAAWKSVTLDAAYKSELLVVATEDGTQVEITPSVNTEAGNNAGAPFVIQLDAGQLYRVKGQTSNDDLTGTRIKSTSASGACRPFAVFSGSECALVPSGCNYCDHLVEQNLPITTWGNDFFVTPFDNMNGYTYRVLGSANGTTVSIDGGAVQTINAGQFLEFNNQLSAHTVLASAPVAVIQYMQGFSCAGAGDPSMLILNSGHHVLKNITFSTVPSNIIENHYVNVVIESGDVSQLWLDGSLVPPAGFLPFPGTSSHVWASLDLTPGSHTLSTTGHGFAAYVYGMSSSTGTGTESYTYSAGFDQITPTIEIEHAFCTDGAVTLQVQPTFTNVRWYNALDTTIVLSTGNNWDINPPIANGLYLAKATEGVSGCETEFNYSVESPTPPVVTLTASDTQICEHQSIQLNVNVEPASALYTYDWTSSYGLNNTTIANPVATPDHSATYTVVVSTPTGCASAIASLDVQVLPGSITRFEVTPEDARFCVGNSTPMQVITEAIIFGDDFDPSVSVGFWGSGIMNGQGSNICGAVTDNALYFTGTGTRSVETPALDVSNGGTIYFALKIANGVAPCDNAEPGDNVVLAYRAGAGAWTNITTYYENAYPDFTNIEVPIPAAAMTSATQFRWKQVGSWAGNQDNWCLDNVFIGSNTTQNLSIAWTPSAGLSSASAPNPIASPSASTMYHVTVSDGSNGCVYTDSVWVDVGQNFTLEATEDTSLCDVQGILLHATPSISDLDFDYVWSPNDGSISSIYSAEPTANPTTSTAYHVDVTSSYGCTSSADINVNLVTLLDLDLTASDISPCAGETLNLTANVTGSTAALSYAWTNNNGYSGSGSNVSDVPQNSGTYTVVASDVDSGCALSESIDIEVTPAFTLSVTPSVLDTCTTAGVVLHASSSVGGVYNWSWSPAGDLNNSDTSTPSILNNQSNVYVVTATTPSGCSATATSTVNYVTENTNLGNDLNLCAGETATLNTGYPTTYTITWSTNEHTPSIEVSSAGTYHVSVLSPQGCQSEDEVEVTYHEYPVFDMGSDHEKCDGEIDTLRVPLDGYQYFWHETSTFGQFIVTNQTGTYHVTVSNGFCSSDDSIHTEFFPLPRRPFANDTTLCFDDYPTGLVLNARNEGSTWVWQDETEGPTYYATEPGMYAVDITTEHGCSRGFSIEITSLCAGAIYIPNAFTPDGDGINESWKIEGENVSDFSLRIWNKWGELIYESKDMDIPWSGQRNEGNHYVETDSYMYRIDYTLIDDNGEKSDLKTINGNVLLIR
jgi:gliding motility-associated-like protein